VNPEPNLWLQIGTDPTPWVLADTDYDSLAAQLSGATGPVVLPVVSPLQGQLVLSPRAAGAVSLLRTPWVGGPHPVGDPPTVGGPHPVGDPPAVGGPHPVGDEPSVGGPHPVGEPPAPGGSPAVYLPSVTGGNPGSPVNVLAPGTDLATVQQDIVDAMNQGTFLTLEVVQRVIVDATNVGLSPVALQVSARSGNGQLVLNGAGLAFAVLAQIPA
jgi:hypothetical protein